MVMEAQDTQIKPGYKLTEVGVIPEEWEVTSIGEVAFVTKLAGFEYTKYFDYRQAGTIIAIRALNIKNGMLDLTEVHTIPLETSKSLPRSQLAKGDLVISYVGALLGQVTVIPEDNKFHLAPNVAKISVNLKHLNPLFLSKYLNGKQGQSAIYGSIASSGQPALSMRTLREITIILPPLPEQRAIATALTDIDALITSLDKLIAKKRDIKQATMQQLLTGKMRLPGFSERTKQTYKQTNLGMVPTDWELIPLGLISAFITKGTTPTTYGFGWANDGVLFLRSECVSEQGLDLTQSMFITPEAHNILRRGEVREGDILITITGNVGRIAYLKNGFGIANTNQHIARIRILDTNIDAGYIFHFLSHPMVRKYYYSIVTGQAYPQISLKQVRDTRIPIPPTKSEQHAIATVLSDMDAEIVALEQKREKTRMLKQGMMQELLTGKTRLV